MANADVVSRAEYDAAIAKLAREIAQQRGTIVEQSERLERQSFTIEKFKQLLFGTSSEKSTYDSDDVVPGQTSLFDQEDPALPSSATTSGDESEEDEEKKERKRKQKKGPRFSPNLEHKVVEVILEESERGCECGDLLQSVGVEKSEKLEVIPARFLVLEIHRHKYACGCKASGVQTAPVLPTAFPKSAVTDETRAHFLVQKFVDYLPYYRQSAILARGGADLADATIGRYAIQAADLLAPIVIAMCDEVLTAPYIQADETTLPVLKTEKAKEKKAAQKAYLWSYGIPRSTVVFDYRQDRSGRHPTEFLDTFQGIVQTDRYGGYNAVRERNEILDVACWAHARRKFVEAKPSAGRRVKPVIQLIGQLYAVEKKARESNASAKERLALRQEHSVPVLNELREQLDSLLSTVLPGSPLGTAVEYTLTHWQALQVYTDFGQVEIDTNLLENSIRPVALGRKNYLFAGSETGAEAAATIYSITETCRRLGLNPYDYLVHAFRRFATTEERDPDFYRSLTPLRVKQDQPAP